MKFKLVFIIFCCMLIGVGITGLVSASDFVCDDPDYIRVSADWCCPEDYPIYSTTSGLCYKEGSRIDPAGIVRRCDPNENYWFYSKNWDHYVCVSDPLTECINDADCGQNPAGSLFKYGPCNDFRCENPSITSTPVSESPSVEVLSFFDKIINWIRNLFSSASLFNNSPVSKGVKAVRL